MLDTFSEVSGGWLAMMAGTILASLVLLLWILNSWRSRHHPVARSVVVLLPFAAVAGSLKYLGWPLEMAALSGVWCALPITCLARLTGLC